MIGRVVSVKMQKSAVILVESIKKHPLYRKTFKRSKKYLVDDPIGVKLGDIVEIVKIRPISKRKHWKIIKILGSSIKEIVKEKLKERAEEEIAEIVPEGKEKSADAKAMADKEDGTT